MREFWVSSGHHLLDRGANGGLVVTDAFLKACLARPEILPPSDACAAERALHARLMEDPRAAVPPAEVAALADTDARENWRVILAFRDHLLAHPTLEAAYVALARDGAGAIPPLFLNQLVHAILRNALDGEDDAYVLRAAECLFRPQKLSNSDGTILLADEETVGRIEGGGGAASPLLAMFGGATAIELDVLGPDNARRYHARSDGFDFVLDFGMARAGRAAFARAIETWVRHLLGVDVKVEPLPEIRDDDWAWFVGLDAEATKIGNALWRGEEVSEEALGRVVALFRLTFENPAEMLPRVAGRPVYLILAMTPDRIVRVKPQNLAAGLPIAASA